MSHLEVESIKDNSHFGKFLSRYPDNILSKIKKTDSENALECLNTLKENAKFTIEKEKNGKLSYLNFWLERRGSHIEFDMYGKPSSSQNYFMPIVSIQPFTRQWPIGT